jgi:hypothetical protein
LLEIDLKILLRKTGARLNFKIALISLHIDSGLINRLQDWAGMLNSLMRSILNFYFEKQVQD